MRKTSKILLLIWDILLIPVIVTVIFSLFRISDQVYSSLFLGFALSLGRFLSFLFAVLSGIFLPQVISLVLVTLSWAMPFRHWERMPEKKEIIHTILLTIAAIAGAICSYLALAMMTRGEMGVPLP